MCLDIKNIIEKEKDLFKMEKIYQIVNKKLIRIIGEELLIGDKEHLKLLKRNIKEVDSLDKFQNKVVEKALKLEEKGFVVFINSFPENLGAYVRKIGNSKNINIEINEDLLKSEKQLREEIEKLKLINKLMSIIKKNGINIGLLLDDFDPKLDVFNLKKHLNCQNIKAIKFDYKATMKIYKNNKTKELDEKLISFSKAGIKKIVLEGIETREMFLFFLNWLEEFYGKYGKIIDVYFQGWYIL